MFKDLLKSAFKMRCRVRWLKTIDKEIRKRDKHYTKYKHHEFTARELLKEYENQYTEKEGGT